MLFVCFAAICLVRAESVSVTGTWDGMKHGRKAVTVEVREREGILGGTVVFYILHDNGNGALDGAATEPVRMQATTWDGAALRFQVGEAVMEMRVMGSDRGELKVVAHGQPETLSIVRRR
jgi:hypothetical protein